MEKGEKNRNGKGMNGQRLKDGRGSLGGAGMTSKMGQ